MHHHTALHVQKEMRKMLMSFGRLIGDRVQSAAARDHGKQRESSGLSDWQRKGQKWQMELPQMLLFLPGRAEEVAAH